MTTVGPKHLHEYDWVRPSPYGEGYAKCQYCPKASINIGSIGGSALRNHAEGTKVTKHKERESAAKGNRTIITSFASKSAKNKKNNSAHPTVTNQSVTVTNTVPKSGSKSGTITSLFGTSQTNDGSLSAEILWTLHTITNNNSFHSNTDVKGIFQRMFTERV